MTSELPIVVLHGLWQPAVAMHRLVVRLRALGHQVESWGYPSFRVAHDALVPTLVERLQRRPAHLVGHSLGGLLGVEATRQLEGWPGRVVALGSPFQGSSTALHLARQPWGRALGASRAFLQTGVAPWTGTHDVGVIAGDRPWGIGRAAGSRLQAPHDGTVTVEETRLRGARDHVVIEATHTTLVHHPEVARQIDHFLRHGCFAR